MFFIISKVLDFLIAPIVWSLGCLLWAFFTKNPKRKKRLFLGSILILYFFSNQAIFYQFSHAWEMQPRTKASLKAEYGVAIILGGIVSIDHQHKSVEFHSNSDRFLNVLPLYFEGKVKKLLLSGGSGRIIKDQIEAGVLEDYLLSIGVAAEDLITEEKSQNTYENAKYSAGLIREKKIDGPYLLSTSTTHMRRSVLCFKKQGLDVDPFPTDQVAYNLSIDPYFLLIPQADTIQKWYWLIHEWVGILTYKLMGYC